MINKNKIKNMQIIGFFWSVVLGSLLHFTFESSGNNPFVGLFSAVNESVWEHTKLYFFPLLLFMIYEIYYFKNLNKVLMAKVLEISFGIIFIISFYYVYTGALGIENFLIDISSFFVAVAIGKLISYRVLTLRQDKIGYTPVHLMFISFILLFFWVTTFMPPEIPLFEDHNTKTYGASLIE